ncbi:MAG: hypothetical protein GY899_06255 [Verrucomicrobiaceae bacterium]|nr:hypothetical protein [Verrucomicrobiaceae bacterium]
MHTINKLITTIGITLLLFSSCRSYHVSLTYTPPERGIQGKSDTPKLRVGRINDARDIKGTEIGAIRNEFGVPIKTLHAKRPIAQIAHNAFAYALKARNMSTVKNPKYTLSADIIELWCHQYTTQDAGCRARINIYNTSTKNLIFSKEYSAKHSRQTLKITYWSSVEEVATVVSHTLQEIVDNALDDPDFRRAVR